MSTTDTSKPRPFNIQVPEEALDNLRERLSATRWPVAETVKDWSQGVPLDIMKTVAAYWAGEYNWRKCERKLNAYNSQMITLNGVDVHFLHVRSNVADARPLILTHGWPGSIVEFLDVIPMLTDPLSHGGSKEDAFDAIIPSIPGYGFSGKPTDTGWNVERIADTWASLMTSLGYEKFYAQGGDWGSAISVALGQRFPERCLAAHINLVMAMPNEEIVAVPTKLEIEAMTRASKFQTEGTGYSALQSTRPQTLGYGLSDSPVAQAAWVLEKFYEWTDNDGTFSSVGDLDHLIDNVMMYWLNEAGVSSARLYWEGYAGERFADVTVPIGCSIFPKDLNTPSRRWAETRYKNIFYWNEVERGGHFAAWEQPELFTQELRNCFRSFEE